MAGGHMEIKTALREEAQLEKLLEEVFRKRV